MAGAQTLILIGCLLQCALSQWAAWMPSPIEALSGSCVVIPCTFQLGFGWDSYLDKSCKAIWKKGWYDGPDVFDSSLTGQTENTIKGSLNGDLLKKDCTTTLNIPTGYSDDKYYFRLECSNGLKWTFLSFVNIKVKDSPSSPTLTPGRVEVKEGDPVSLSCSASAPCPSLPPTLTWTPRLGDSEKNLQENQNNLVTAVLTFTASYFHHGQTVSCTSLYKRQDGNHDLSSETTLTISVLYPPKITSVSVSPSGPVLEGSSVTLTCSSDANPAVDNYTWYKSDGWKNNVVGSGQNVTFKVTKLSRERFYCKALNDHGVNHSEAISLDVTFAPEILSTTGCTRTTSQIRCHCESHGNPLPVLEWRLDGESVNQSADLVISEQLVQSTGLASSLTVCQSLKRTPTVVCISTNSVTFDRMAFNVPSEVTPIWTDVHAVSLLIGVVIGALGMMLLCIPLQLILCKRRSSQLPNQQCEDTAELTARSRSVSNGSCGVGAQTLSQYGEEIYANKAMLVGPTGAGKGDPDSLHYAIVGFSRGQARAGANQGEIRGMASRTAEYAVVRHRTLGADNEADTVLGQRSQEDGQEEAGAPEMRDSSCPPGDPIYGGPVGPSGQPSKD